ncbi:His-Xaa-Ser system radical SAM maturase HxsC [Bacteroides heparinolyticus]|uniref:His-Xaa-Ser system radical SAM maturase HxsC n=1 Tax=Prevotella heparinolytica TaxID=28113 RepID=UPI0023F9B980|nr:His-Xaa-Ser system radical SAM maturase HxsC [Bacteroides heparinolyticus]MCI6211930.1 His-Xaa-Ser system radical SAM maturase HxsC [Bacteroides heparinolyticus]
MKERFEIDSNSNVLFVTNQCNNHCIMCCQPPQQGNDFNFFYNQNVKLIKSAPKETKVVCITGGEPTLAGNRFIDLITLVRKELPSTDIHILSNGRTFINNDFTHQLKVAGGDKVFVGVPLHSDYFRDHDIIAGAKGAFNETMLGLYNLADEGIPIELRIVVNKLNYNRLYQLAEYIFKNLYFVSWVAFMGMEDTGWATKNAGTIWIEPIDYINQLCIAVKELDDWDIPVAIYNIPLCLLPTDYHRFAAQSISDWKTRYLDICTKCTVKDKCCGLFGTSKHIFKGLSPI